MHEEWGPLAKLVGTWEGDKGVDVSIHHDEREPEETKFRERATFEPFGPVNNTGQVLYGLDYRTQAWPLGDENPFHMEVGYWLWDAAAGLVMRCFMVPRGQTILAGGKAAAHGNRFTMRAEVGSESLGILSNPHMAEHARTTLYTCDVAIDGDTWSYDESLTIALRKIGKDYVHRDRNTLRRVG